MITWTDCAEPEQLGAACGAEHPLGAAYPLQLLRAETIECLAFSLIDQDCEGLLGFEKGLRILSANGGANKASLH